MEHLDFNSPETLKAAHDLRENMEAAYRNGDRKLNEMLSVCQQRFSMGAESRDGPGQSAARGSRTVALRFPKKATECS